MRSTDSTHRKSDCLMQSALVLSLAMAVHRQGECWISRRYKRALTGTANGGRHKAMPCLAEEVLKAPVGQPAFQQLKGAAALYCQSPSLSRSLAARHIGAPLSPVC